MRDPLRRHTTTIVVAVITAGLTAAAPALAASFAAFARNSDKVDGIGAVTAKAAAKPSARRGVLVATDPKSGLLPTWIIPPVARGLSSSDSETLGGVSAAGFLRSAPGAVGSANLADGAITGAKVDEFSLATVPSAAFATSAATAANALALGGVPLAQVTTTLVDQVPLAALNTNPTMSATFDVPAGGYITWTASCLMQNSAADQYANLNMGWEVVGGASQSTGRSERVPGVGTGVLTAIDWVEVGAGTRVRVSAVASGASTLSCATGRLVATYSSTTREA